MVPKLVFSDLAMAIAMFALLTQLVTGHPTFDLEIPSNTSHNISTPFTCWAQFCDDTDCSVNCGGWVDMMNPGCLNEGGRQSIRVKSNGPDPMVGLVYSPGEDCNCQTECDNFSGINPDCYQLNASRAAESLSYRFIGWGKFVGGGGQCSGSENNCPGSAALDAAHPAIEAEQGAEEQIADAAAISDAAQPTSDDADEAFAAGAETPPHPAADIKAVAEVQSPDAPDTPSVDYKSWARFCNDDDCSKGCGIWVDITNSGCLGEQYRGSVAVKQEGGPNVDVGLVYSPGDSCNCQTECQVISPWFQGHSDCYTLDPSLAFSTHSYRFINSGTQLPCGGSYNNCP